MPLSAYVASDFHVDKNHENVNRLPPAHPDVPYMILAGDIGDVTNRTVIEFFEKARSNYRLIFVAGNHDLYSNDPEYYVKKQIKTLVGSNGYFLDDSSVIIDGVEVIGSTLWSDVPIPYRHIFKEKGKYKYDIVQYLHENSRAYLNDALSSQVESEGRILVTHYPVSTRFKTKEWMESPQANPPENEKRYFNNYNNWLDLTDVCIAGHSHYGAVFNVNNPRRTLCIQNSVGHRHQRTKYEAKRFVCIKKEDERIEALAKNLSDFSW